jgi:hypothetical protein
MPFLVIRSSGAWYSNFAVATLKDAKDAVAEIVGPHDGGQAGRDVLDTAVGMAGTITLEDGSTVTVKLTTWQHLVSEAGSEMDVLVDDQDPRGVISAYNARQAA